MSLLSADYKVNVITGKLTDRTEHSRYNRFIHEERHLNVRMNKQCFITKNGNNN